MMSSTFVFKFLLASGGVWCIVKGILDGIGRMDDPGLINVWRGIFSVLFVTGGIMMIYFSNIYPPLTDFLEPLAAFIWDLPGRIISPFNSRLQIHA